MLVNLGIRPTSVPNCGNIAPSDPEINATLAAVAPENDIVELPAVDKYPVAVPLKRIVCSPAVSHVQVYVVASVLVRSIVLPETVPYDDVF